MATLLVAILFLHSLLATPTLSHSNWLSSPSPSPSPLPSLPETNQTCPADSMKVHMCLDLLYGMIHIGIGPEAKHACCPVFMGLIGVEAAICVCFVVRGSFMGLQFLIPMAFQVLAYCGNAPPPGFVCPFPP